MKAFLLIFLLISAGATANSEDEVQNLMVRCHESLEGKGHLQWNLVRVRTILELGIQVPLLASFSINPEIEFYFSKK